MTPIESVRRLNELGAALTEAELFHAGLMHLTALRNLFTIDVRRTAVSAQGARRYRDHVSKWLPDVEVLL
jgi:hypothetical protein